MGSPRVRQNFHLPKFEPFVHMVVVRLYRELKAMVGSERLERIMEVIPVFLVAPK